MPTLMHTLSRSVLPALALGASGCFFIVPPQQGGYADPSYQGAGPADPAGGEPAGGMSEPAGAPGGGAGAEQAASPAPSRPIPTTVEVRSECSKTVPVFYGEKPKFGSGTRSSVSSNSISSQGRKADGTLTVWIIDGSENGIASAHVTPETKRVVIDRSCTSIRAE
jgi:hypothetical protein